MSSSNFFQELSQIENQEHYDALVQWLDANLFEISHLINQNAHHLGANDTSFSIRPFLETSIQSEIITPFIIPTKENFEEKITTEMDPEHEFACELMGCFELEKEKLVLEKKIEIIQTKMEEIEKQIQERISLFEYE
jgi:hypothetical protein